MAVSVTYTPAGGAPAAVGNITGIDVPRPAREALDITPLDAPQGCRTYAGGLLDGGEAVITGFHSLQDPGQCALRAAFAAGTAGCAAITLTDGTTLAFDALARAFAVFCDSVPMYRAVLRALGTITVSGPPDSI
jgi:hypothetical protein